MPKKKKPHRPSKHKARRHPHVMFDHEHDGHHARLRKHHHAGARKATAHKPSGHRHAAEHRTKTGKKASRKHKPSALIQRLREAEAVARQQLRGFGQRRKQHQPEKLVTEQTLRNHMALRCVRRCSH